MKQKTTYLYMNNLYINKPITARKAAIRLLLALFALLCHSSLQANTLANRQDSSYSESTFPLHVGLHVGTTGFGLQLYTPLGEQFGVRLGASFMPFNTSIQGNYSNRETESDVKVKAHNISALFSWRPFYQSAGFFRSFAVNAGGAFFYNLDAELTTKLAEPYRHGDIMIDEDEVGEIRTDISYKKTISPYLGVGFNDIRLDDSFSLQLDLGSYYLPKPSVSITGTGLLQGNGGNAATVEDNIKNYRFLPRVEVGVSYRIR